MVCMNEIPTYLNQIQLKQNKINNLTKFGRIDESGKATLERQPKKQPFTSYNSHKLVTGVCLNNPRNSFENSISELERRPKYFLGSITNIM